MYMERKTKVIMSYPYRHERREKLVTLSEIAEWTRNGKYQRRVEAVRGLADVAGKGGMSDGPQAAEELPKVWPARGKAGDGTGQTADAGDTTGGYTGLVLLSFRIGEGVEALERLRRVVNQWEQTVLSFVGTSGQSLKVVIAYRLTGGGLPATEAQVALFQ